jgi:hypothetical protein
MKKALLAVAALSCIGSAALAGPNAGGTLIAALSVGTVYTVDHTGYCGSSTTTDCNAAVTTIDGSDTAVINIIAAFPGSSRLAGLTFGISYSAGVVLVDGAHCGDFELADGTWPASGTGTAVTWGAAQTDQLVEVYWFAAYNYDGTPQSLGLIAHPGQGGNFADDDVPSNIDPIAGYGVFGFAQPGSVECPGSGPLPGACCFPDGSCEVLFETDCAAGGGSFQGEGTNCETVVCPTPPTGACCIGTDCVILTRDDCATAGGNYIGDDSTCDPNPCVVPTIESSWGEIKNSYR